MNTLRYWFDYVATAKIVLFGLLIGAAIPTLFAVSVRLGAAVDGGPPRGRGALIAARWAIFLLLLALIAVGVLFIARDFIEHRIGWQWDDWDRWGEVFGRD